MDVAATVLTANFDFRQPQAEAKKTAKDVQALEKAAKGSQGALNNAGKAAKGAAGATAFFGKAATGAVPGVAALGTALKAALGPIAVLTTAAGALTSAFSTLAAQDFAEAKVRSLGVNSDELTKRLSGVSRELAGQASVVELTGAAYDVASAGFTNAADAAGILKAASQGATGGFSDINTVGDATTSVLNAYGLEADKAAKLVDGFIQTQNDGKIVIGEYAANIAKVAPVAAALGVPLEEVNAAVAQITAGGQGAEVTFTALKTAFAQVAAGKVGDEFKKFGVEISASTLKTDGLAGTLEKIKKSGADAGTVIKAFGTEAGPSILALLNDTEKYNKLLKNQENSQGAAAEAAFEASNTINGALKRLQTAFTNIFADGSELGFLLKSTFQVAAVTVEVLGAKIKLILAPIRAIFAAVNQVGIAISEALGLEGVNAAFELEKAFQFVLGGVAQLGNFIIGLGVRVGKIVGGLAKLIIDAGKNALSKVTDFFEFALSKIVGFLTGAYNLIPLPIRKFLEGGVSAVTSGVSAVTSFVGETIALGRGFNEGAAGAQQQQQQQQVAQNAINPTAGKLNKNTKEQADMSEKLLDLNRQLREEKELGNEREIATLELMVDRQKIEEGNLEGNKKLNALEEATFNFRKKIFSIDQKAAELADQERKKREADEKARREADPGFQMKQQLEELLKLENQVAAGATAIGNAFANSFKAVITGSKSAEEALADMMASVAEHFLNMAAQIIAQQLAMILYGTIMKALGVSMPSAGSGEMAQSFGMPNLGEFSKAPVPFTGFADGGYVSGPTNALVGEGGESEYIIPESKMRESMARYSRGARGSSVIPEAGGSGTSGEGGGVAVAAPIDVRYSVERINSVDYVTADQFQQGIRQAADQGAKQGEQQTLRRLQMSSSTRKRLGM